MPEISEIAIKKWIRNYGGVSPTLDFSNGARIGDKGIDSSGGLTWRCTDNTIGSPVWVMEDLPGSMTIYDRTVSSLVVGKVLSGVHFNISYVLAGGLVHQNGEMTVSHNGTNVVVDNEYGGISPTHVLEVSGEISAGNIVLNFDTTGIVGSDLILKYTIENKQ